MIISEVGNTAAAGIFGSEYVHIADSQDIAEVIAFAGHDLQEQDILPDGVTAAFVLVHNGDYSEIWVTESSRTFSLDAVFTRVR